ncbi:MAG: hypothetical protein ACI9JL_002279 [Paracoccaceae bacterium]|jgi:hypothetical protein
MLPVTASAVHQIQAHKQAAGQHSRQALIQPPTNAAITQLPLPTNAEQEAVKGDRYVRS